MPAIKHQIDTQQTASQLAQVAGRMADPGPALEKMGLLLIGSVLKNFKAGGRPIRWKPSKRARREGGQTLIDTARLKNSITRRVAGKTLYVGTNVAYGAIHQFGGRIHKNVTVSQHWRIMRQAFGRPVDARRISVGSHQRQMDIRIPARPFLAVQDADRRYMDRIVAEHVLGG